eukprot:TRINITY_DN8828_c0_g1_i1.p1 TRINITY_DN8828_c0_g1~~TRINITY_DN8828_c0_g1_i1.p1  ORF type:complete len:103 (+),score=32.39 TRINITY_DN8828_c0_g1_i1:139-447(+)
MCIRDSSGSFDNEYTAGTGIPGTSLTTNAIKAELISVTSGVITSDSVGGCYGLHPSPPPTYSPGGSWGYILDPADVADCYNCLLYTSPSPRDRTRSRMPSSA